MKDLKELDRVLRKELEEIREKENKTLNDRCRYKELQEQLRKVYDVTVMLVEMNNRGK